MDAQARIDDGDQPRVTRSEPAEIRELRQRKRLLEQEVEVLQHAEELNAPTLILHGTRDGSVPIRLSRALRNARPDLVEIEPFDAGHTLCWNSDLDRWQNTVIARLKVRIPR